MKDRFWDRFQSWADAECAWDERAALASVETPLKVPPANSAALSAVPKEKFLRWKAIRWVVRKDVGFRLSRLFLRHPLRHIWRYLCSVMTKKSYLRDGDFFFYGIKSVDEMQALMQRDDVLLLVGCSYCEKPYECPSGRFGDGCCADPCNPVCQQCFVGKVMHSLPHSKTIPVIIPTINAIGGHVLEVAQAYPKCKVLFVITACQMALEMFGDFGNMVGIQGIGVRFGGRVCNTMRAFALSEEGVKPGLTVVLPSARRRMLDLLRFWRKTRLQEGQCPNDAKAGSEKSRT